MQIADMKAFRVIRSQALHPSLTSPSSYTVSNIPSNRQFSRHFRSTFPLSFHPSQSNRDSSTSPDTESNSAQSPRVWSIYRAATSSPRGSESSDDQEDEVVNSVNSLNSEQGSRNDASKGRLIGDVAGNRNRRRGKSKVYWVCSNCGHSHSQWWGACQACDNVGTVKQFSVSDNLQSRVSGFEISDEVMRSWLPRQVVQPKPLRLSEVNRGINQFEWRIPLSGLFGVEVARVLGGGLVPGSLVLVGGDPGVGKSTLMLQIAAIIAEGCDVGGPAPVLYVSGEESVEQIGNRADRMRIGTEELFLYSSTDIQDILENIQHVSPRALIVDSIQTAYLKGVTGGPGGLSQVKECTSALLRFAKKTNIPVLLIGHVNKSGDIAGPHVLEHIVDVVLYMEGEKHSSHRLLRSVKNRFGSTDELGVFEMSQSGLQAVSNPSEMFLTEQHSDSEHLAGLAVAVIIDGSRTFLIEVQALCVSGMSVARHVNGVPSSRADMIISVLVKQAGLKLEGHAIFLNVVSGVSLNETAGDLAVAAAICSRKLVFWKHKLGLGRRFHRLLCIYFLVNHIHYVFLPGSNKSAVAIISFLEFSVPNNVAFIGEVGLGGELRMVPRIEKRVNTVAKLGYKMCVVPKPAEKSLAALGLQDIKIVGCRNMKEVIDTVFR
ncbi:hypothetical protein Nepgr_005565 [Nepenthes gracilis]|uniref:RecA family profile 1 domain-containing protein n=1 Tax=Nepenthes gracilis TaxID=150966 RepID=A0AAD3S3R2_NEPGR|nr:hypothetical protein Nepgr_005565 [Nepenthes gracilis]